MKTNAKLNPLIPFDSNMSGDQPALLDRAYTALKESVYDALIPQTRLKPYLDDISLALDAEGNFGLDFAANNGLWEVAA
jgi:4'-phosphopantetheinyl transferase EntD